MKREELDKLISDYVDAPSDEKEMVLKDAFGVCLDLMSRTVDKINSSGLEVDSYSKCRLFHTFFSVYNICDGMTDVEIDSVGTDNAILKNCRQNVCFS